MVTITGRVVSIDRETNQVKVKTKHGIIEVFTYQEELFSAVCCLLSTGEDDVKFHYERISPPPGGHEIWEQRFRLQLIAVEPATTKVTDRSKMVLTLYKDGWFTVGPQIEVIVDYIRPNRVKLVVLADRTLPINFSNRN